MTQPSNSPPDPAQWNWVDTFERAFVGPDYDVTANFGTVSLADGVLLLAANLQPQYHSDKSMADYKNSVSLHAERWNNSNVSVQWDFEQRVVAVPTNGAWTPPAGVEIIGDSKTLQWDGQRLSWGGAQLAAASGSLTEGAVVRHRLTVDRTAGRIQVLRGGAGVVDVALPSDYDAGMGAGGRVQLFASAYNNGSSPTGFRSYDLRFDNLAVRLGDGTADLSTGQVGSSGGVRLGGEWRFGAAPDDAVGADGDVWATPDGGIYQRIAGVYTLQMTLIGAKGDKGDTGEAGAVGAQGPQGPAGNPVALRNPILVGLTPTDGYLITVVAGEGGFEGVQLLGLDGPAATVEISSDGGATWAAVTYPHILAAGEALKLLRTDQAPELSVLRAYVPVKQGSGGAAPSQPLSVTAGVDGFLSLDNATATTDPEGFVTIDDATATTDPEGFVTLERSTP